MAGGNRVEKLSRQVQKDIGEILQKEELGISKGVLVTVTKVRMTPDLKIAKIYFSMFPADQSDEVLKILQEKSIHIRFLLGKKLRNQVREIPEIFFYIDDSLDYIDNIEQLLKE